MPPYGCLIFQLTLSFVDAAQIRVCGKNPKRWCSMRYLCMFIWLEYQMPRKLCINSHSTGLFVRFRDTHTRAYWRSCPSYSTARLASRCRGSLAMAIYTRSYWWWLLFGNAACECCLHAFALQPLKVSFPSANCQCGDVINNDCKWQTHTQMLYFCLILRYTRANCSIHISANYNIFVVVRVSLCTDTGWQWWGASSCKSNNDRKETTRRKDFQIWI